MRSDEAMLYQGLRLRLRLRLFIVDGGKVGVVPPKTNVRLCFEC